MNDHSEVMEELWKVKKELSSQHVEDAAAQ